MLCRIRRRPALSESGSGVALPPHKKCSSCARDGARLRHLHGRSQSRLPLPRLPFAGSSRQSHSRPSVLVSAGRSSPSSFDTTPDFRFQALRYGLESPRRHCFSAHGHADHILGFDEFDLLQSASEELPSRFMLRRKRWQFCVGHSPMFFDGKPVLSTVPEVLSSASVIEGPFELLGIAWKPILAEHGDMLQN